MDDRKSLGYRVGEIVGIILGVAIFIAIAILLINIIISFWQWILGIMGVFVLFLLIGEILSGENNG